MWGTKQTDYNITETPFHRDYLKELSDECRKQGIKFGAYYSILDFYNYDYQAGAGSTELPNPDGPGFKLDRKPDFDRYVEYMKAELKELIKDYHVEILLFDGNWEPSWTHERGSDLYRYLHSLNPSLLISNRVDTKGSNEEARLMGYSGALWVYNPKPWNYEKYAGDYLEREVYIGGPEPYPWEAWITFTGGQWAWKPNDTYKSPEDVIRYVVVTAGNGGNLNLNVSPMLDGRFEERQKETLLKIGTWLKANGESIYGTRGGPFESGLWGGSTRKGNTLYVHVLAWPGETLRLPPLEKSVKSAQLLHGGEVHWKQTMNGLEISVSESRRDPLDTILELTVAESGSTTLICAWGNSGIKTELESRRINQGGSETDAHVIDSAGSPRASYRRTAANL